MVTEAGRRGGIREFCRRWDQQGGAVTCVRWSVDKKSSTVTPRALILIDLVGDSGIRCGRI